MRDAPWIGKHREDYYDDEPTHYCEYCGKETANTYHIDGDLVCEECYSKYLEETYEIQDTDN